MLLQHQGNRGFVTLLSTLVVTVLGMSLAFSLVYRAGISASAIEVLERSFYARNYADACAEEALRRVRAGDLYAGSDSFEFDHGTCEFTVTAAPSESTVQSSGIAGEAVRKVQVVIDTVAVAGGSGTTTDFLDMDWTELADF